MLGRPFPFVQPSHSSKVKVYHVAMRCPFSAIVSNAVGANLLAKVIWRLFDAFEEGPMSSGTDISTLYREFTLALTDVLPEHAAGPASRGRLARTRAAVKKHPETSEHGYFLAVETAFGQGEALQTVGHLEGPSRPQTD
jgi:hypothetical protein